jgi:hypothetical protein
MNSYLNRSKYILIYNLNIYYTMTDKYTCILELLHRDANKFDIKYSIQLGGSPKHM